MKNLVKRVHFVGIGGTGMCGIAEVLHNLATKYLVLISHKIPLPSS